MGLVSSRLLHVCWLLCVVLCCVSPCLSVCLFSFLFSLPSFLLFLSLPRPRARHRFTHPYLLTLLFLCPLFLSEQISELASSPFFLPVLSPSPPLPFPSPLPRFCVI